MATTIPGTNGLASNILPPGLLANRPAPGHHNTGKVYTATDYQGGTSYLSTGLAWVQIGSGIKGGGFVADSQGHPLTQLNSAGPPTVSAGAGVGVGGGASIPGGTDISGQLSVNGGIGASTSATICTVTFNKPWDDAPLSVALFPANSNAALLSGANMVFVAPGDITASTWKLTSGTSALANLTYLWYYTVLG